MTEAEENGRRPEAKAEGRRKGKETEGRTEAETKVEAEGKTLNFTIKTTWLSYKERRVDALALRADERRDKLR